ncbi:MAG: DUF4330 domain-containing protein [Cyanobacteria bacterium P01_G01_bin.49]
MKLLDSKGRLFGKVSILDLGAALAIFLVIVGIFVVPGKSGTSITAQVAKKNIEVDVIVRGLGVSDPSILIDGLNQTKKTNIVIRNQPSGQFEVKAVKPLPRTTVVPQPDGSVKALPDPRPEVVFFQDMILTLEGKAQITDTGAVVGQQKVKIGTLIELEGKDYNFNTSTIAVRVLK